MSVVFDVFNSRFMIHGSYKFSFRLHLHFCKWILSNNAERTQHQYVPESPCFWLTSQFVLFLSLWPDGFDRRVLQQGDGMGGVLRSVFSEHCGVIESQVLDSRNSRTQAHPLCVCYLTWALSDKPGASCFCLVKWMFCMSCWPWGMWNKSRYW